VGAFSVEFLNITEEEKKIIACQAIILLGIPPDRLMEIAYDIPASQNQEE